MMWECNLIFFSNGHQTALTEVIKETQERYFLQQLWKGHPCILMAHFSVHGQSLGSLPNVLINAAAGSV